MLSYFFDFRCLKWGKSRWHLIFGFALSLVLVLTTALPSAAIQVSEVPNPRQLNSAWVSDVADLLSPASERQLNQLISALEAANGTEIAVVTVPNTQPSPTPKAFATELFNAWGIGKAGVDNGVLFLVSKGDRRTEVETGYGVEAVLPDAKVGEILRRQVTPRFREGNFDAGILAGTEAIVASLRNADFSTALAPPAKLFSLAGLSGLLLNRFTFGIFAIAVAGFGFTKVSSSSRTSYAIRIQPVGRTRRLEHKPEGHILLKLTGWLCGDSESVTHQQQYRAAALNSSSINDVKRWWMYFSAAIAFGFLVAVLLFPLLFPMLLASPLWLGLEVWLTHQHATPDKRSDGLRKALVSVVGGYVFCLIVNAIVFPVIVAFAVLVRRRRLAADGFSVVCNSCEQPMAEVSEADVKAQLTGSEKIALQLGSTEFDALRCDRCASLQAENGFDLHLFSTVVQPNKFGYCEACQAYTEEGEWETIEAATEHSKGRGFFTATCACCGAVTQTEQIIPRRMPPARTITLSGSSNYSTSNYSSYSSSNSNSYDSSSYSSSDYSSSYDSGGSDFGGGDSGGGGAGDSW